MRTKPLIGIYWLVGGRIVAFTEPADAVLAVGGVKDSDLGHDAVWLKVVKRMPRLRGKEYWQVPRGRVLYRVNTDMFILFGPTSVVRNSGLVSEIARWFRLSTKRFRAMADEHYELPTVEAD